MTQPDRADVIVVGAGMAGLTAAVRLAQAGLDVTILDKGRAVGGRMATRRIGEARYDHGAQHFSARSEAFATTVAGWLADGVASVWYEGRSMTQPERGREPRHVGTNGMRGIPTYLAEGLDVRLSVRVARVETVEDLVEVSAESGGFLARSCILTAPIPQLLEIVDLSRAPVVHEELRSITYDPCLAVMAELDAPSGLTEGHAALAAGPVAWIADNQSKGASRVPSVTIHSSAAFAVEHLDHEPMGWTRALVDAAEPHLDGAVRSAVGHRWRFSRPRTTRTDGCFVLGDRAPVVLAGEVFAGAKVEGAYLSGVAAAEGVLERLA